MATRLRRLCSVTWTDARQSRFIEPMFLLRAQKLPEGREWVYGLKLDGYRALAIKSAGKVHLLLRNDNDFDARYPGIVKALAHAKPQ